MEIEWVRLFFVFLAGYFLCFSGSLSQLVSNNSIASPSTLGMDGVAVLMIIVSQFTLTIFDFGVDLQLLSYFIFIVFLIFLICAMKIKKKKLDSVWDITEIKKIIILGLAFNLFIGAIFSIIQFMFMALNFEFPSGIWFGNFKQYEYSWSALFLLALVFCIVFIKLYLSKLSLLNLGRGFSSGVGVDVSKVQNHSLLLALFLTGTVICFFGVFSFLGLILPHILRSFKYFSSRIEKELLVGPVLSGVILCFIDFACYHFTFYGAELPVGMTSGVIGAFFLIMLIVRQKV